MDQLKTKGQTALEYLLIVVVAIIVVVAVMVWMNASSSANIASGTQQENMALCRSGTCTEASECTSGSEASDVACRKFDAGTCVGVQNIGGTEIAGNCAPNATAAYDVNGDDDW